MNSEPRTSTLSPPPESSCPEASPHELFHYRINLVLFLIIIVSIVVWFKLHLEPFLDQSIFVGIPLTVLGLWKLVKTWLPKDPLANPRAITSYFLGRAAARENLLICLVVMGLLFLTTSSVYVEQDRSGNSFQIEVFKQEEQGQRLYLKPLTINSYDKIDGRPFFFHISRLWNPVHLIFKITKPFGYEFLHKTLYPWSPVRVRVPTEFTQKTYRIGRLIPGQGLWQLPPRVLPSDPSNLGLIIHVGGKSHTLSNLLQECVYFGASRDIIQSLINDEPFEARKRLIKNSLVKYHYEQAEELSDILASSRQIVETAEVGPHDEFVVELITQPRPIFFTNHIAPSGGIQSFFLKTR